MSTPTDAVHFCQSVRRRIPGNIRVIQALLYFSVFVFTVLGAMAGLAFAAPALLTLLGAWYFMGLARVTYDYRLDGTLLSVERHSGMRSRPRTEDFLRLDLRGLIAAGDEGAPELADAEERSRAAVPRRIVYDVSAHDPARGCAVAYAAGTGAENGRMLKVYFQPCAELNACLRQVCPGKVFIHDDGN